MEWISYLQITTSNKTTNFSDSLCPLFPYILGCIICHNFWNPISTQSKNVHLWSKPLCVKFFWNLWSAMWSSYSSKFITFAVLSQIAVSSKTHKSIPMTKLLKYLDSPHQELSNEYQHAYIPINLCHKCPYLYIYRNAEYNCDMNNYSNWIFLDIDF